MTQAEKNKLIERTAKHDAYQAVYLWIKGGGSDFHPTHGDGAWYANEKMMGHVPFLKNHKYRYDYAASNFIPNDGYYGEPDERPHMTVFKEK